MNILEWLFKKAKTQTLEERIHEVCMVEKDFALMMEMRDELSNEPEQRKVLDAHIEKYFSTIDEIQRLPHGYGNGSTFITKMPSAIASIIRKRITQIIAVCTDLTDAAEEAIQGLIWHNNSTHVILQSFREKLKECNDVLFLSDVRKTILEHHRGKDEAGTIVAIIDRQLSELVGRETDPLIIKELSHRLPNNLQHLPESWLRGS